MKFLKVAVLFFGLAAAFAVRAQGGTYPVSGRVIDRLSRRPVAYAAVVLAGQEQKGASTDSLGRFRIERVKPGIWRLAVSSVGYKSLTTPEYMVSAATPFIEVELEEDAAQLADCYRNSQNLAKEQDVQSIAFPAISTGVYGYPLEDATAIAVKTVAQWLEDHADYAMQVIFCCFDARTERVYQARTLQQ